MNASSEEDPPTLFAFDFDGVIVNSASETGETAWRAAHTLWPDAMPPLPTAAYRARFPALRPVIETGFENVPLVALFVRGVTDADILANFQALASDLIDKEKLDRDDLRRRFGRARDAWIESDPEGWLAAQSFYPGVVDAINGLRAPRCIITTKEDRFTRLLVERAGLRVDANRIYALESFENRGKRGVLQDLAVEFPRSQLHFFEDRYPSLAKLHDLERTSLYLVDWGYNTPAERDLSRSDPGVELLDATGFAATLRAG